ncbi:MAG: 30S ribosome-binding factor RbfA [Phycisphaerae bacterium]|nr:30S ribosome-binding factor RbfA [Phycisphaerae bacterium]
MTHRREKLESSLQRIVGRLLSEGLADPRIQGLVSVTEVRVDTDGRVARIGVSVLPESSQNTVLGGLRHCAGHLRREVGQRLRVRSVPELEFVLDESLKKQAAVLDAIREVVPDPAEDVPAPDAPTSSPE